MCSCNLTIYVSKDGEVSSLMEADILIFSNGLVLTIILI